MNAHLSECSQTALFPGPCVTLCSPIIPPFCATSACRKPALRALAMAGIVLAQLTAEHSGRIAPQDVLFSFNTSNWSGRWRRNISTC
jgi:hypothetical protein